MTKETTETKFSEWCKKNNLFRIKLAIDKSSIMMGANFAKSMPSDYIVLSESHLWFVEVKEVLKNKSFPFDRLKQQFRLTKLSKQYQKQIHSCHVLIYFKEFNVIAYWEINEFNKFQQQIGKESFNIDEIPNINRFEWKTLKL